MDTNQLQRCLPPPRLLTTTDLSQMLGLSVRTTRRYLRDGVLPGTRLRGRWYASREAIIERVEMLSTRHRAAEVDA
ncbi:MAG: hypothetical protein DRQ55_15575 [Planctomycetota bacterium]|nr:MAG: hypothetical protein DRQ55_15575 [Planctomycetota bacterium]